MYIYYTQADTSKRLRRRHSPFGGKIKIVIQDHFLGDAVLEWPWNCNEDQDLGKAFHLVQVLILFFSR